MLAALTGRLKQHAWASLQQAEARAFTTFRERVLARHHAGRQLDIDERFDLSADARHTLSHFA